jgi:hypothetical protein
MQINDRVGNIASAGGELREETPRMIIGAFSSRLSCGEYKGGNRFGTGQPPYVPTAMAARLTFAVLESFINSVDVFHKA